MGLAAFYAQIRFTHITCVAASGSLFALRGLLALAGFRAASHIALRSASWAIDTTLLTAALMLTGIVHQYPFVNGWLTTKVVLLVAYVGLGSIALRHAHTQRVRTLAYAAALAVFLLIVAVAHWRNPLGPLHFVRL